jgi:hypothetical protein
MACGPLWIVKPYIVAPEAEDDLGKSGVTCSVKQAWQLPIGFSVNWWTPLGTCPMFPAKDISGLT